MINNRAIISITQEFVGKRLDTAIIACISDMSRTNLQQLFKNNCVAVNGVLSSSYSKKILAPCEVIINLPKEVQCEYDIIPENIPLHIVFEDEHIVIINKQSGIVCHPSIGHKNGTIVNALKYHFQNNLSDGAEKTRPGIIHRLDKDTSGLMIIAKTNQAHHAFANMFSAEKGNLITRRYICFVYGVLQPKNIVIENFIARHPKNRQEYCVNETCGKKAKTICATLKSIYFTSTKSISMLECELLTGRTHQIRVHMKHIGHHVIGDPIYGKRSVENTYPDYVKNFERQALHSNKLSFIHPITQQFMEFSTDLPEDLCKILDLF